MLGDINLFTVTANIGKPSNFAKAIPMHNRNFWDCIKWISANNLCINHCMSLTLLFIIIHMPQYWNSLFPCQHKYTSIHPYFAFINPRHMREGYGSLSVCVSVCVCLSVCYHASCYIPRLYIEITVPLSFLWCSQDMHCVDFIENTSFKSSGDIC